MKKEVANSLGLGQLLDYVADRLIEQKVRCMSRTGSTRGSCAYGDGAGNHCGVGWILDEENKGLMSAAGSLSSIISRYQAALPHTLIDDPTVWKFVQLMHDKTHRLGREATLRDARKHQPDHFKSSKWDEVAKLGSEIPNHAH